MCIELVIASFCAQNKLDVYCSTRDCSTNIELLQVGGCILCDIKPVVHQKRRFWPCETASHQNNLCKLSDSAKFHCLCCVRVFERVKNILGKRAVE